MKKKLETAYGVIGLGRFGAALAMMLAQSGNTSSTSENDIGATSERRRISSSQYRFGKISECIDIICPNLINVGPKSSKIRRSFSGDTPLVILCFRSTPVISFNLSLYSCDSCLPICHIFLFCLELFIRLLLSLRLFSFHSIQSLLQRFDLFRRHLFQ